VTLSLSNGVNRLDKKYIDPNQEMKTNGDATNERGTYSAPPRTRMDMDLSIWRNDLLEQGVIELPVTGRHLTDDASLS
jgi:hypothetical protein